MKRTVAIVVLIGAFASAAHADLLEIAPDLYLLMRSGRVANESRLKMDAIRESLEFARSRGMVAIPISGRQIVAGDLFSQPVYEYQFRLVTREAAEANRANVAPLADVVITSVPMTMPVQTGVFTSAMIAPTADIYSELIKLGELKKRNLLSPDEFENRRRKLLEDAEPPATEPPPPPATPPAPPN